MNFKYRCKIKENYYNIQIYNLEQEKIKIMINTKNLYSDEYNEYSNIYTLNQFQEITKYYILFENIEEVYEDLIMTIQKKNFTLANNGSTMSLCIKVTINNKEKDVIFILDKTKTIDLSSQKDNYYYNTLSSKNSDLKNNFLEKSRRNIDISNINDLNNLLGDLKDRIMVLENNQNRSLNRNEKEEIMQEKYINNNNYLITNDKITQGLENILSRLQKLENDNKKKDEKIKKLEKKLQYYKSRESPEKYNTFNTINNFNNKNINQYQKHKSPNYIKTFQNKYPFNPINSFNKFQRNKSNNNMSPFYQNKKALTLTPNYLRQNKTDFFIKDKPDNTSFHSKETANYFDNNNNDIKTNSTINSNNSNIQDKNFQKYLRYKEKLRIPIVPREDIRKFVNSRIIFTKNELRLLKLRFTKQQKNLHAFFDLLYRASIDGDWEEIAKEKVRNKAKTLTLFYTYEGARFGVYTSKEKKTSFIKGKVYEEIPGTSFMVSLNNLKFFEIRPGKTSNEGESSYLSFGKTFYLNDNGTNWIISTPRHNFLKKKCIIGDKGGNYVDLDTELLVGTRPDYHIKDVEIFEVSLEKDYDSEEEEEEENDDKKKKKKKKNKKKKKIKDKDEGENEE